jgi:hypothetical protein
LSIPDKNPSYDGNFGLLSFVHKENIMPNLEMRGPFDFTREKIDLLVEKKPGNFALGRLDPATKKMVVNTVGRADTDLNAKLKELLSKPQYKAFKFSQAADSKAAYDKECNNWHDFGGKTRLDCKTHPVKPEGSDWKCPKCGE